ncbi:MAG: hypothetical protein EOO63_14280 [Hymenobacter sp.]|nr:MAG: hypothetical protein EOO63_14280 [Hymenobacter sp.]
MALASQPVKAQTGGPDIVIVRLAEGAGTIHAVITRGEGKSEEVEFQNGGGKRLVASSEGYYKLINKLYQEGYTLKNSFSSASMNAEQMTLLFVKGQ